MATKPPNKPTQPEPGDPQEGRPAPPIFEPATDEPDDDEDERAPAGPAPSQARTSRRGFLGAVGAMAAGAAVAAVAPEPEPAAAAATAAVGGMSGEMREMMQMFAAMMAERDARQMAAIDEKLAGIRAEIAMAPPPNGTFGSAFGPHDLAAEEEPTAELAAPPGQHPSQLEQAVTGVPRGPRMVAFIPKEDPYNPRQTTFKTWVNGREIRSKRGQVMILTLGHGIDLAKNGHGNCVDIAAMQGVGSVAPISVPQVPNFARPSNWDGMPLTNRSSFAVGAAMA